VNKHSIHLDQNAQSAPTTTTSSGYDGASHRVEQVATSGSATTATVYVGGDEEVSTSGSTTTTTTYYADIWCTLFEEWSTRYRMQIDRDWGEMKDPGYVLWLIGSPGVRLQVNDVSHRTDIRVSQYSWPSKKWRTKWQPDFCRW
jgi:hypothetical protein